jgi:phosphopentomutase
MVGFKRALVIVFDSLGVGELPDAGRYGDTGSHTLDNLARAAGTVRLPNLASLGLGLIDGIKTIEKAARPRGSFGRMREASPGKDTATGHWEMAGVVLESPFPVFTEGFSREIMDKFTELTGHGWLWAKAASGTEIIDRFGEEHLATGKLIVYTSADSVFQIAAHDRVLTLEELYKVCEKTRLLADEYNIGRVIARPFTGSPGAFERVPARRDFAIPPPYETLLDLVKSAGLETVGIGKIGDIFVHKGLTEEVHTASDNEGIDLTIKALGKVKSGFIFTNLVDLDTLYGHRNDAKGYARALEAMDARLPEVMDALGPEDILFITGDHGCDPTTPSTDHSREYVPLLAFGTAVAQGVDLGTRETFADLGATIAEALGAERPVNGRSFLREISR